jgi:hypothetical protein
MIILIDSLLYPKFRKFQTETDRGMLNSYNKKLLIAKDALLFHPYFNKPFGINMDATKVQIGACLWQ